jgi:hypothetical protein
LLTYLEPAVADSIRLDSLSTAERSEAERTVSNVKRLQRSLLEHAHGTATPATTPNLLQLNQALRGYEEIVRGLMVDSMANGWITESPNGSFRYERPGGEITIWSP